MLNYRRWSGEGPTDLREARVSAYLRGDDLQLNGARCYFWVNKPGVRWHMSGSPLTISEGEWASEPNLQSKRTYPTASRSIIPAETASARAA